VIEAVERASEGNPLFLHELLRLMVQRGDFQAGDPTALPLPDTVKDVISRRIGRLRAEPRALLELAAVIGREFATPTVAALAGVAALEAEPRLAEAERAGLLLPTRAQGWRFSHVLVREALYRGLDAGARAAAHLKIAEELEAGREDDALAEVAHHRLAAQPAGDPATAAGAAGRAADRAMAMLAFEDAAVLYERAYQTLASLHGADPRVVCELRLRLARAHLRAGALERGRAACLRAAEEARRLADGALIAQAALTYGSELNLALTDDTLVALLEEALTWLPPGRDGLRAECLARLAAALQPHSDPDVPIQMAREAVATARENGDPAVLMEVLSHAGSALADYGEPGERAAVSEELIRLAAAARDRVLMLRGQSRLVFDHLDRGLVVQAEAALDGYEVVAEELRQARHRWPGRLMRAMLALGAGRFERAERLEEEAREIARGEQQVMSSFVFANHLLGRALITERAADAAAAKAALEGLREERRFGEYLDDYLPLALAALRTRERKVDAAREHLDAVNFASKVMAHDAITLVMAAEAAVLVGDRRVAEVTHDRLTRYAGRFVSFGRTGMVCFGVVDTWLGMLAGFLGRPEDAERHFELALARERAAAMPPTLARTQAAFARFLLQRGQPGDEARARALAAEAGETARRLDLPFLAAQTAEMVADVSATTAPGPATGRPLFTLAREGEYWTVTTGEKVARLRGSRGLEMLAELVARPGQELHVLTLMGAEAVDGGDAGVLLDQEAVADYRGRVEELDGEIAEAESWGDPARAARAREERAALARELARGVGLGGRERRSGGAAERARTNVQRRIRGTIRKIGEALPELGAYLERAVRTGTYCSYEPF
jgi:hypothetical protein